MSVLEDWTEAVCTELGIGDAVDRQAVVPLVLGLARDAAHKVARPAAPLTAYLLGIAAARAQDPVAAAPELARRLTALAEQWERPGGEG